MTSNLRRVAFWGILAALVAIGLLYAFWPQPVIVDVTTVERGSVTVSVYDEGETRIHDVYVLSAPVTGRVKRIEAHVGDPVAAWESVVAEIEPIDPTFLDPRSEAQAEADVQAAQAAETLARAEVDQAAAELEFAERELERARRLIEENTISQRDLDEAERAYSTRSAAHSTALAALSVANFELDRAKAQLLSPVETQRTHGECACVPIRAPVNGRVLQILHQSAGVVEAGTALAEIGNPTDLEIVVDLLSADAVKVEPGQEVIIENWGGDSDLAGRVRVVEPFGFTKVSALGIEEQRVNVIIDLTGPAQAWARLAHGYQVDTRIIIDQRHQVLKLPITALFRSQDQWAVFVMTNGRAVRREIEIGAQNSLEAQVLSGVEEGEQVVLHPSERVVDGVRVSARG